MPVGVEAFAKIVPRNRVELTREQKVAEILDAAERRLDQGGFESLSMLGLARELGLAQNAIYWYFPSRAELFVAVLRRMLESIAARKPRNEKDTTKRILWGTDQLAPLYRFRAAMQEQAEHSDVAARFTKDLDDMFARMLANVFRGHVADEALQSAVETFRCLVTGTYAEALSPAKRRKVLAFYLAQLTQKEPSEPVGAAT
jgi:AcrR family transcriptional regulator